MLRLLCWINLLAYNFMTSYRLRDVLIIFSEEQEKNTFFRLIKYVWIQVTRKPI
jgi:hypothetical protein